LQTVVQGPGYESKNYGFVKYIDASAILGKSVLHVFLANRSQNEPASVEISYAGLSLKSARSAEVVTGSSAKACNTFEEPDKIRAQQFSDIVLGSQKATVQLPPLCVVAISFDIDDNAKSIQTLP